MRDKRRVRDRIVDGGVIAVLRGVGEERIVPVARAIHEGGVDAIEITADGARAAEKVAAVDRELADDDAVVGVGTVRDAATAQSTIDAGAQFVVSPHTDVDVIRTCHRHGVLAAPGVLTPTEAATAIDAGADVLKLFPAASVGPSHVGALRGPFGDIDVIPTGGVTRENAADFLEAGAVAVGAGGAIVDHDAIDDDDMDRVRETAAAFVETIDASRGE